MPATKRKPIVLVTGAAGGVGRALTRSLRPHYTVVGLDRGEAKAADDAVIVDLSDDASVTDALATVRERHGNRLASVVHLAAYFDFTGEDNPLYETVNVEGTRRLLRALRDFDVGQFVYSGTMLVHAPGQPGERIDETKPIDPRWAYPRSKAAAEDVIRRERGDIPCVLLHLAGIYDERTVVPTLAQQIARIYERDLKSHFYAGDLRVGQSFLHRDDMIDAFRRTIDRRSKLPDETTILVGEADAVGYGALQDTLGRLIHGDEVWATLSLPKPLAKAGAWVEQNLEPVIPDAIDQGEEPFIRPFMIDMAEDHYALDIGRARALLGWKPKHRLLDVLPALVANLKADPVAWYTANGIVVPAWMESAAETSVNPEELRAGHDRRYAEAHGAFRWAAFANMAMGSWLITSPPLLGYAATPLAWSDAACGIAVLVLGFVSLSARFGLVRWAIAAVGVWLLFAPLIFWTPFAAGYLNDTLVGALVFGFAALARPAPGVSAVAAESGPVVPVGWTFSPSSWTQRLPIIVLALVGLYVSRYLTAYQLGHIDGVWEPFFKGGTPDKNGTEYIITSSVSEAWPVPDAGVGAVTYILEILTGLMGSARRWRTMPWLVILFGIMIVPLGVVSMTFIIIQPIAIGTWCTLCLIGAAAMLVQIPYSLDELVATGQFMLRRKRAGRPLLHVFLFGDTDEGPYRRPPEEFARPLGAILRDVAGGGVSLPWNLAVCFLIGAWLMLTRLTLGAEGAMANADHLIGSLVLTVTIAACAEVGRPLRFVNMLLGLALLITPFVLETDGVHLASSVASGMALIALSVPRGRVRFRYGTWDRHIV